MVHFGKWVSLFGNSMPPSSGYKSESNLGETDRVYDREDGKREYRRTVISLFAQTH